MPNWFNVSQIEHVSNSFPENAEKNDYLISEKVVKVAITWQITTSCVSVWLSVMVK